jgi:hypothetical protein
MGFDPLVVTAHRHERDLFIAAASEFCELSESARPLGTERFLLGLARALPRLHAAGVELPYPDDELPDDELEVDLSADEMKGLLPVGDILTGIDWNPVGKELHDAPPWPIAVFLYDDLYDIYHDLKTGFRLIEAGRPEAEAVFHWRLNFWGHWGYHNAEALRVIHYYVATYLAG